MSVISSVFCRFIFRKYTFSCGAVLPLSKISSTCRSEYVYVNSLYHSNHIFYGSNKHNPFSGHRVYLCRFQVIIFQVIHNILLNPICYSLMANSRKTRFAQQQSIVATPQRPIWSKPNADTFSHVKLTRNYSSLFNEHIELQQAISVCGQYSWKQPKVASNTDNIAFIGVLLCLVVLRCCELLVSGRLNIT